MNKIFLLRMSFGLLIFFGIMEFDTAHSFSEPDPILRAQAFKDCLAGKGCDGFKPFFRFSGYERCMERGCNYACINTDGIVDGSECKPKPK